MSILTIAKMGHSVLERVVSEAEDPTDPEVARRTAVRAAARRSLAKDFFWPF